MKRQNICDIRVLGWMMACFLMLFFQAAGAAANNVNDGPPTILQPEDAAPADAQKLGQRFFTGNTLDSDCSYYQLLLNAERYAAEQGADLLHVVSRTGHSRTQRCDEIEVAFYHSDNPRASEQTFSWNATRPLSWDDFRGGVRGGAGDNIAAETSCGIAIETNLVAKDGLVHVYVFNTFDKRTSWVREGYTKPDVLQHEQGHWDICELYTRKMQARFNAARITGTNLHEDVSNIYDEVSNEYLARQERYEQETQHGTIDTEQQRWSAALTEELLTSSPVGK